MIDTLSKEIYVIICKNSSNEDIRDFLLDYKNKGMTQKDMYNALELLRKNMTDEEEDKLLEVMDIVSGFCIQSLKIFD